MYPISSCPNGSISLEQGKPVSALSLTGFVSCGPLSPALSNLVTSSISMHIYFRTARRFYPWGTLSGTPRVNCLDQAEIFQVKFMVGASRHSACSPEGRLVKKLGRTHAKVKTPCCVSAWHHNGHVVGALVQQFSVEFLKFPLPITVCF